MNLYAHPRIDFCEAVKRAFQKYADFSGRIRRSEFWYFVLFINICTTILIILNFATCSENGKNFISVELNKLDFPISIIIGDIIYLLVIILPVISSIVRRFHDIGKKGYYIFILFVPFWGQIAYIILLCTDSQKETNIYGPSPKYYYGSLLNIPLDIIPKQNGGYTLELNGIPQQFLPLQNLNSQQINPQQPFNSQQNSKINGYQSNSKEQELYLMTPQ